MYVWMNLSSMSLKINNKIRMYNLKQNSLETSAVTKCFICCCVHLNIQYHSICYKWILIYIYGLICNPWLLGSHSLVKHQPSQWKKAGQQALARLYLYLPLHAPMWPLCKWMVHATKYLLRVKQSGCHALVPSLCQSYSLKSGTQCWI